MLLSYISSVPEKGMNTIAMESFKFFISNKVAKLLQICFVLCHGVWSVDWCVCVCVGGGVSNIKQFNRRQQHNKPDKINGWILSQGSQCIYYNYVILNTLNIFFYKEMH